MDATFVSDEKYKSLSPMDATPSLQRHTSLKLNLIVKKNSLASEYVAKKKESMMLLSGVRIIPK
jgi:hypothetical protein